MIGNVQVKTRNFYHVRDKFGPFPEKRGWYFVEEGFNIAYVRVNQWNDGSWRCYGTNTIQGCRPESVGELWLPAPGPENLMFDFLENNSNSTPTPSRDSDSTS